MKTWLRPIPALCLLVLTAPAFGAAETEAPGTAEVEVFDASEWAWCNDVDTEGTSPGFVRLAIGPEVFDRSQAGLSDLRLIDPVGQLEPFVMHWGRTTIIEKVKWRRLGLLNETYEPDHYAQAVLDFRDKGRRNRLRVRTSGKNFRRRVTLEGSDQTKNWQLISENLWLFDLGRAGTRCQMDVLEFPTNDFRYLRLTAFNMEDDPQRIGFVRVEEAFRDLDKEKELTPVKAEITSVTRDEKAKQSLYAIDLGYRNLPIAAIEFQVVDAHFHRAYELMGRNAATETVERETETGLQPKERDVPWQRVTTGVLYRAERKNEIVASTKAEYFRGPYRYLQLRVFDGDNAPLQIDGVSVMRREVSVVFEPQGAEETYSLIGGNPKAGAPTFDLARSIQNLGERELPEVQLGPARKVERIGKPLPWTERNRALIWVVLIGVVVFMVGMIAVNFRKVKGETPDE
jgi:uncharacterized protein DUF3999